MWLLKLPLVPLSMQTAKALARLRRCAGLPEPLLFAYVSGTLFTLAGSLCIKVLVNRIDKDLVLQNDACMAKFCVFAATYKYHNFWSEKMSLEMALVYLNY